MTFREHAISLLANHSFMPADARRAVDDIVEASKQEDHALYSTSQRWGEDSERVGCAEGVLAVFLGSVKQAALDWLDAQPRSADGLPDMRRGMLAGELPVFNGELPNANG